MSIVLYIGDLPYISECLFVSAHLWALADPEGADMFLHCEDNCILHLPSHLVSVPSITIHIIAAFGCSTRFCLVSESTKSQAFRISNIILIWGD